MNLYISRFPDGVFFLILRFINKMATDGGGGEVDGERDDFTQRFQAPQNDPG